MSLDITQPYATSQKLELMELLIEDKPGTAWQSFTEKMQLNIDHTIKFGVKDHRLFFINRLIGAVTLLPQTQLMQKLKIKTILIRTFPATLTEKRFDIVKVHLVFERNVAIGPELCLYSFTLQDRDGSVDWQQEDIAAVVQELETKERYLKVRYQSYQLTNKKLEQLNVSDQSLRITNIVHKYISHKQQGAVLNNNIFVKITEDPSISFLEPCFSNLHLLDTKQVENSAKEFFTIISTVYDKYAIKLGLEDIELLQQAYVVGVIEMLLKYRYAVDILIEPKLGLGRPDFVFISRLNGKDNKGFQNIPILVEMKTGKTSLEKAQNQIIDNAYLKYRLPMRTISTKAIGLALNLELAKPNVVSGVYEIELTQSNFIEKLWEFKQNNEGPLSKEAPLYLTQIITNISQLIGANISTQSRTQKPFEYLVRFILAQGAAANKQATHISFKLNGNNIYFALNMREGNELLCVALLDGAARIEEEIHFRGTQEKQPMSIFKFQFTNWHSSNPSSSKEALEVKFDLKKYMPPTENSEFSEWIKTSSQLENRKYQGIVDVITSLDKHSTKYERSSQPEHRLIQSEAHFQALLHGLMMGNNVYYPFTEVNYSNKRIDVLLVPIDPKGSNFIDDHLVILELKLLKKGRTNSLLPNRALSQAVGYADHTKMHSDYSNEVECTSLVYDQEREVIDINTVNEVALHSSKAESSIVEQLQSSNDWHKMQANFMEEIEIATKLIPRINDIVGPMWSVLHKGGPAANNHNVWNNDGVLYLNLAEQPGKPFFKDVKELKKSINNLNTLIRSNDVSTDAKKPLLDILNKDIGDLFFLNETEQKLGIKLTTNNSNTMNAIRDVKSQLRTIRENVIPKMRHEIIKWAIQGAQSTLKDMRLVMCFMVRKSNSIFKVQDIDNKAINERLDTLFTKLLEKSSAATYAHDLFDQFENPHLNDRQSFLINSIKNNSVITSQKLQERFKQLISISRTMAQATSMSLDYESKFTVLESHFNAIVNIFNKVTKMDSDKNVGKDQINSLLNDFCNALYDIGLELKRRKRDINECVNLSINWETIQTTKESAQIEEMIPDNLNKLKNSPPIPTSSTDKVEHSYVLPAVSTTGVLSVGGAGGLTTLVVSGGTGTAAIGGGAASAGVARLGQALEAVNQASTELVASGQRFREDAAARSRPVNKRKDSPPKKEAPKKKPCLAQRRRKRQDLCHRENAPTISAPQTDPVRMMDTNRLQKPPEGPLPTNASIDLIKSNGTTLRNHTRIESHTLTEQITAPVSKVVTKKSITISHCDEIIVSNEHTKEYIEGDCNINPIGDKIDELTIIPLSKNASIKFNSFLLTSSICSFYIQNNTINFIIKEGEKKFAVRVKNGYLDGAQKVQIDDKVFVDLVVSHNRHSMLSDFYREVREHRCEFDSIKKRFINIPSDQKELIGSTMMNWYRSMEAGLPIIYALDHENNTIGMFGDQWDNAIHFKDKLRFARGGEGRDTYILNYIKDCIEGSKQEKKKIYIDNQSGKGDRCIGSDYCMDLLQLPIPFNAIDMSIHQQNHLFIRSTSIEPCFEVILIDYCTSEQHQHIMIETQELIQFEPFSCEELRLLNETFPQSRFILVKGVRGTPRNTIAMYGGFNTLSSNSATIYHRNINDSNMLYYGNVSSNTMVSGRKKRAIRQIKEQESKAIISTGPSTEKQSDKFTVPQLKGPMTASQGPFNPFTLFSFGDVYLFQYISYYLGNRTFVQRMKKAEESINPNLEEKIYWPQEHLMRGLAIYGDN